MKAKQFFIFIGRSGCGKGTQAQLLKESLESKGYEDVLHVTTGGTFREMMQRPEYIPTLSKGVSDNGGLVSEFLAIWNWSNIFIDKVKENTTMILDGAPRRMHEAHILENAISYLNYKKPTVVHIEVSELWAKERLSNRNREDDNDQSIDTRMEWYIKDVESVIEYYKHNNHYDFLQINGEDSIENIHKDLMEKLNK